MIFLSFLFFQMLITFCFFSVISSLFFNDFVEKHNILVFSRFSGFVETDVFLGFFNFR